MRLIDADALPRHKQLEAFGNGQYEDVEIVYSSDIDNAPTIDPFKDKSLEQLMDECFNRGYQKAIKHGEWYAYDRYSQWMMHYKCSECNAIAPDSYNYCPNCGAKMKGERW